LPYSVRSQLQRVPGGSRDDSSPVRGALLGASEASGDLKGSLPADFADSLALPRRSRKVVGNDGLAAVAENERFGTSRQPAQGGECIATTDLQTIILDTARCRH
jgi:hypothetical protein